MLEYKNNRDRGWAAHSCLNLFKIHMRAENYEAASKELRALFAESGIKFPSVRKAQNLRHPTLDALCDSLEELTFTDYNRLVGELEKRIALLKKRKDPKEKLGSVRLWDGFRARRTRDSNGGWVFPHALQPV